MPCWFTQRQRWETRIQQRNFGSLAALYRVPWKVDFDSSMVVAVDFFVLGADYGGHPLGHPRWFGL